MYHECRQSSTTSDTVCPAREHPSLVGSFPCDFPLVGVKCCTKRRYFVHPRQPPTRSRLLEAFAQQTLASSLDQTAAKRSASFSRWALLRKYSSNEVIAARSGFFNLPDNNDDNSHSMPTKHSDNSTKRIRSNHSLRSVAPPNNTFPQSEMVSAL